MQPRARSRLLVGGSAAAAVALAAALALPAVGQAPSPSPGAAAEKPGNGPRPGKGPATRVPQAPEVAVTLSGVVGIRTAADDDVAYTLTVGETVYVLHVGPPWWWGESHPLTDLVGRTVTITGERAEGSPDVDVFTVEGRAVREPGRPPWAGGWKAVGERHPGWSKWRADLSGEKVQGRGAGRPPWAGPKTPEGAGD